MADVGQNDTHSIRFHIDSIALMHISSVAAKSKNKIKINFNNEAETRSDRQSITISENVRGQSFLNDFHRTMATREEEKKIIDKIMSHLREAPGVSESQVKLVLIQTLLCLKLSSDACTLHYMHKNDSRERLCFGRVSELLCVCVFSPK